MKCQICKAKTNWDTSMGKKDFIICKDCTDKLISRFGIGKFEAVIFAIGDIRREQKKKEKDTKKMITAYNYEGFF